MKLFYARPPEMQAMLGRLLELTVNESESQDVHDRALFYYRLLQEGGYNDIVSITSELFQSLALNNTTGRGYSDGSVCDSIQMQQEFNSLSVIYGYPCEKYLDKQYVKPLVMMVSEVGSDEDTTTGGTTGGTGGIGSGDVFNEANVHNSYPTAGLDLMDTNTNTNTTPVQATVSTPIVPVSEVAQTTRASMNLLDFDDMGSSFSPAPVVVPVSVPILTGLTLTTPSIPLTPPVFQQMWGEATEEVNAIVFSNTVLDRGCPVGDVEAYFKAFKV